MLKYKQYVFGNIVLGSKITNKYIKNPLRHEQTIERRSQLTHRIKFGYLSPIDKPIQSASLNSIIQLAAQTMYYPFVQWSVSAQASIIIGGIAFRVFIQFCSKLFEDFHLKHYKNRFLYKAIQKVFLVDMNRDIKFYEIDHRKAFLMHKYYRASYLLKNIITFYLCLNFFRGCHYLLTNEQYFAFHLHTSVVPSLSSHDPRFILPLVPMLLTYFWVSGSRHPFLIHLNRPQNFFYRVNIAFMSGLIFVPLPVIYTLGYLGLISGQLLIRKIYHQSADIRQEWRDLFGMNINFIKQRQEQIQNQKKELKKGQIRQDKTDSTI